MQFSVDPNKTANLGDLNISSYSEDGNNWHWTTRANIGMLSKLEGTSEVVTALVSK